MVDQVWEKYRHKASLRICGAGLGGSCVLFVADDDVETPLSSEVLGFLQEEFGCSAQRIQPCSSAQILRLDTRCDVGENSSLPL